MSSLDSWEYHLSYEKLNVTAREFFNLIKGKYVHFFLNILGRLDEEFLFLSPVPKSALQVKSQNKIKALCPKIDQYKTSIDQYKTSIDQYKALW